MLLLTEAIGNDRMESVFQTPAVVSIGPQTSLRCMELLGRVDAEACPHDLDGLVEACVQAIQRR